jgi:hypothetical protein
LSFFLFQNTTLKVLISPFCDAKKSELTVFKFRNIPSLSELDISLKFNTSRKFNISSDIFEEKLKVIKYLLCCEGSCWRSRSHRRVWEPSKGALDGLGSWLLPPEAAAPSDRYHISGVRPLLPAARYKKQNRPLAQRANLAHKRRARGRGNQGQGLSCFPSLALDSRHTPIHSPPPPPHIIYSPSRHAAADRKPTARRSAN